MARRGVVYLAVAVSLTAIPSFLWFNLFGPFPWQNVVLPRPLFSPPSPSLWKQRQDQVRQAYVHAITGYNTHAFPHDELLPLSGGKINKSVCPFPQLRTFVLISHQFQRMGRHPHRLSRHHVDNGFARPVPTRHRCRRCTKL